MFDIFIPCDHFAVNALLAPKGGLTSLQILVVRAVHAGAHHILDLQNIFLVGERLLFNIIMELWRDNKLHINLYTGRIDIHPDLAEAVTGNRFGNTSPSHIVRKRFILSQERVTGIVLSRRANRVARGGRTVVPTDGFPADNFLDADREEIKQAVEQLRNRMNRSEIEVQFDDEYRDYQVHTVSVEGLKPGDMQGHQGTCLQVRAKSYLLDDNRLMLQLQYDPVLGLSGHAWTRLESRLNELIRLGGNEAFYNYVQEQAEKSFGVRPVKADPPEAMWGRVLDGLQEISAESKLDLFRLIQDKQGELVGRAGGMKESLRERNAQSRCRITFITGEMFGVTIAEMIRARRDRLLIQCGPLTGNGINRYYEHLMGRFSKTPFDCLYLSWGERLDEIMPDNVGRYCDDVVNKSGGEFIPAPAPTGHGGRYLVQGSETALITNIPFFGDWDQTAWCCGVRVTKNKEHGNWLADRLLSLSGDLFSLPEVRREMMSIRTGLREPSPDLPDFPSVPLLRNRDVYSVEEGDVGSNPDHSEISFSRFYAWLRQWMAWGGAWQDQWDRSNALEVLTNDDLAEHIVKILQQEEGMLFLGTELPRDLSAPWMIILEALDLRLRGGRRVCLILSRPLDNRYDEVLRHKIGQHMDVAGPLQVIIRPFHGSVLISSHGSLVSGTPMLSLLFGKRRVGQETMAARMGVWLGDASLRREMIQSLRAWDQRIPDILGEEVVCEGEPPVLEGISFHLVALGQLLDEIEHVSGEARARMLRAWAANIARTPDVISELLQVWQDALKDDMSLFEQCVAALLGQPSWHCTDPEIADEWLAWLAKRYWQSERFVPFAVLSWALPGSVTNGYGISFHLARFVAFGQVDETQLLALPPFMAKGFAAELTRRLLVGDLAGTTDMSAAIDLFLDQYGRELGSLGEILRMVHTFACFHGSRIETDDVKAFMRCWDASQDPTLEELDNTFRNQISGLHLRLINFPSGQEAWSFLFDKAKGPVGVLRGMVNLSKHERLKYLDDWLSELYGNLGSGYHTGQDGVVEEGGKSGYEAWVIHQGEKGESLHKEKVSQEIGKTLMKVANRHIGALGMELVHQPRFATMVNQLADLIALVHQLVVYYRERRFTPRNPDQWKATRQLANQLQSYSGEIRAWVKAIGDHPEGTEWVLMRCLAREILAQGLLELGGIPTDFKCGEVSE